MNVSQDLSIIELILNASLVVKLVMLLLIGVSLVSWYCVFAKRSLFVTPGSALINSSVIFGVAVT